jgi:hypothetical protein
LPKQHRVLPTIREVSGPNRHNRQTKKGKR